MDFNTESNVCVDPFEEFRKQGRINYRDYFSQTMARRTILLFSLLTD